MISNTVMLIICEVPSSYPEDRLAHLLHPADIPQCLDGPQKQQRPEVSIMSNY